MMRRTIQARRLEVAFRIVVVCGALFLALTVLAMLLYPGGRVGDPNSQGYAFFSNFFSDLGQTRTYGGHANLPSLILFCTALGAAAVAIAIFFVSFAALFERSTAARMAANAAAVVAIAAAVCFIGVAVTP